jgi:hypothetical protein
MSHLRYKRISRAAADLMLVNGETVFITHADGSAHKLITGSLSIYDYLSANEYWMAAPLLNEEIIVGVANPATCSIFGAQWAGKTVRVTLEEIET